MQKSDRGLGELKIQSLRARVPWLTRGLLVLCAVIGVGGCGGGGSSSNTRGSDPPTNTPPATTPDTTAPTVPAMLTATAIGTLRVDLSWTASTDDRGVTGYRVYRNGATNELTTVVGTTYSDTTVMPGTTYSYAVRARDAAGNLSGPSATATATTATMPSGPLSGLDARPSNTTCLAWERPTAGSIITLAPFTALTFTAPVALLQTPRDSTRWFVPTGRNRAVLHWQHTELFGRVHRPHRSCPLRS